jgi:hypothetical protein
MQPSDDSSNYRRTPLDGINAYYLNKSDGGGYNNHRVRNTVWNGAHYTIQTAQGDQARPQSCFDRKRMLESVLGRKRNV